MSRSEQIRRASEETFDLVVIGGGINGAAIAWEATSRGLRVALVDKGDFGAATSSGCFKIVHGGLRYLQHLNFPRVFESVAEQRNLLRIAPYLVHPFPFMVPCSGFGAKSKWFLEVGVSLYEAISRQRNSGVVPERKLPKHRVLSAQEALQMAPGMKHPFLNGAVVYYDCQMSNCERLTLAFVMSAVQRGAVALNYVKAQRFVFSEDSSPRRIQAVACCDQETGINFSISASYVINATGPWAMPLVRMLCQNEERATVYCSSDAMYSKGIQAILPDCGLKAAVVVQSKDIDPSAVVKRGGRSYFLVPWRGHTLVGTADALYQGNPNEFQITEREVHQLISSVKLGYNSDKIDAKHVSFAFGGLRLIDSKVGKNPDFNATTVPAAQHERIIDHALLTSPKERIANLLSVEGVKYTTARGLAEQVVSSLARKSFVVKESQTNELALYGSTSASVTQQLEELRSQCLDNQTKRFVETAFLDYGMVCATLLTLLKEQPALGRCLVADRTTRVVEVVHAVRNEMALHISDVVCRRTALGQVGYPGNQAIQEVAEIMSVELGWDTLRTQQEIALAKSLYQSY